MAKAKKVKKVEKPEEEVVVNDSSKVISPREYLEAQLKELNDLRSEMQRLGIDSASKLDAKAGQLIAEINKL